MCEGNRAHVQNRTGAVTAPGQGACAPGRHGTATPGCASRGGATEHTLFGGTSPGWKARAASDRQHRTMRGNARARHERRRRGPATGGSDEYLAPGRCALPLGFFAFATGTVLLSALELRWLPGHERNLLAMLVLAFVAPLELFPSALAFLSRDTASGTTLAIFGAGWVAISLFLLNTPPGTTST